MKDKSFDDIIKNKLNQHQPEIPLDAWDHFEQFLGQTNNGVPEPDSSLIDKVAFEKLHDLNVHQPVPNWTYLRRRLDAQWMLRQRLISYKFVEATLMALILLLFVRLDEKPRDYGQPSDILIAQDMPSHSASGILPAEDENPPMDNEKQPPIDGLMPSVLTPSAPSQTLSSDRSPDGIQPTSPLAANTQTELVVSNRGLSEIGTVPGKGNTNHDGFVEVSFLNNDKKTNYLYRVGANAIIDLDITSVESSNALTVSMFGGAVYNRVITPPDESLGIVGFDRYTLGYGGGVNLGFEMGRLEVGSGFGYTAIRYEPIPLLVTRGFFNSGYTAEKFDFVELNVLSLPVYVQYSVFMDDRWRAYTNAGASLQVAYETNFYGVFPQDLPTGFARPRREESSFANRYGWFEGGSFRDNSFVTLNLGFGLERIFSKRTSLFIQPTYAHNLGYFSAGMGPTRDRIHSMSVYSGVRVRFRK